MSLSSKDCSFDVWDNLATVSPTHCCMLHSFLFWKKKKTEKADWQQRGEVESKSAAHLAAGKWKARCWASMIENTH